MELYTESRKPLGSIEYLFECTYQRFERPMQIAQRHIHDHFELLYCKKGSFTAVLNDVGHHMEVGDMVLVDPWEVHSTQALAPGGSDYIVLKFAPEILYSTDQPLYEMDTLIPYLNLYLSHQKRFSAQETSAAGIGGLMDGIYAEYTARNYGYALAIRSLIGQVFVWILRAWHGKNKDDLPDEATQELLRRAFLFIEQNYAQDVTMRDAAEFCGMSYTAFSRFFSQYAKKGFAETLNMIRIKKAMLLLAATEQSVTQIGLQTGFSTTSYFIQRFREVNGLTPRKYRTVLHDKAE